jgi:hypothetical protein
MSELQKLPIGLQNFEKLRTDGYLYVDKTALVYRLATSGRYFFLSRPRRFGRSMLLSTLQAYFEGKKELFEGTAIAQLEKNWAKYPVLHIDMIATDYSRLDALPDKLNDYLSGWEEIYGKTIGEKSLIGRFEDIIRRAVEQTGQRVVILVDEFDKPILQTIGNDEMQQRYRSMLKAFFGVLKSMDGYIKFALLTGITKLDNASVFSDLNNLNDISMDEEYATICGLTDEEIDSVFPAYIQLLAEKQEMTVEKAREELSKCYGGYRFSEHSPAIYNPFSLLNVLDKAHFGSYWFETGTPSYLVNLLQLYHYDLENMENAVASVHSLHALDSTYQDIVPILYLSGYLTIKDYDKEFRYYSLAFPNWEVKDGFESLKELNNRPLLGKKPPYRAMVY